MERVHYVVLYDGDSYDASTIFGVFSTFIEAARYARKEKYNLAIEKWCADTKLQTWQYRDRENWPDKG